MTDRIRPRALHERLQQAPETIRVLDMRSRVEFYAAGHTPEARFVGLVRAMTQPASVDVGDAELAVLICLSGHRSRLPLERLRKAHPHCQFIDLDGGMLAWWAENLPTSR